MHSQPPAYQLIDFGNGRKLENVGGLIVNRPSPGAIDVPVGSPLWGKVDLFFDEKRRIWDLPNHPKSKSNQIADQLPILKNWCCRLPPSLDLKLKPTPTGQIGIFPEHWDQWKWLSNCLIPTNGQLPQSLRVLSLFAYTGATTLFLAGSGISMTHVDSSRPTVLWGRENCDRSGLADKSIRWLVEDARRYVEREIKRGNRYEGIILDPPTYGHGTKEETWDIDRDLIPLMIECWRLLSEKKRFVLLAGHSSGVDLKLVSNELINSYGKGSIGSNTYHQSFLTDQSGRKLDCGYVSRFEF